MFGLPKFVFGCGGGVVVHLFVFVLVFEDGLWEFPILFLCLSLGCCLRHFCVGAWGVVLV